VHDGNLPDFAYIRLDLYDWFRAEPDLRADLKVYGQTAMRIGEVRLPCWDGPAAIHDPDNAFRLNHNIPPAR
jgi:hypothetical protein